MNGNNIDRYLLTQEVAVPSMVTPTPTPTVPEFPSWLVITLLTVAMLSIAVMAGFKKIITGPDSLFKRAWKAMQKRIPQPT